MSQYGHASLICNQSIPCASPFLLRFRAGVAFHPNLVDPAHVQRRHAVAERDFGAVVERVGRALEAREEVAYWRTRGARWPVGSVISELG